MRLLSVLHCVLRASHSHSGHGVDLLEALGKETDEVADIEHVPLQHIYEFRLSIVNLSEDLVYNVISYILDSVSEVGDDTVVALLEGLVLRVLLLHLVGEDLADHINQYVFQKHLVRVLIVKAARLSHFRGSHSADTLVGSLDVDLFDITHWGLVGCEAGPTILHISLLEWLP